eukprot:353464-Chlamydomonas_euryale.AAC.1
MGNINNWEPPNASRKWNINGQNAFYLGSTGAPVRSYLQIGNMKSLQHLQCLQYLAQQACGPVICWRESRTGVRHHLESLVVCRESPSNPCGSQSRPGGKWKVVPPVMLLALCTFQIFVFPAAHNMVKYLASQTRHFIATGMTPEAAAKEADTQVSLMMGPMQPVCVQVPKGQAIVMDGALPHAGHAGVPNSSSLRLFVPLQFGENKYTGDEKDATYPVTNMAHTLVSKQFATKFLPLPPLPHMDDDVTSSHSCDV